MLIFASADGKRRIAVETDLIGQVEETEKNETTILFVGNHRTEVIGSFEDITAAIEADAEANEDDADDEPIDGETAIDASGDETKSN